MKRHAAATWTVIVVAMNVLLLGDCSRKTQPSPAEVQSAAPQEPAFNAGDEVVVEDSRATFFEAVVRRPGKSRLQLDVADAGAPKEVDSANVYPISSKNSGASLQPGSFAICRVAPRSWVGCRIESRVEAKVSVVDENGAKSDLETSSLLKPSAVTELNLKQSFEQALKRKGFTDGARDAGRPQTVKGWTPHPGDHVLIASGEAYAGGRVLKIRKGQVTVVIDGEGKESRVFTRADIYPQPPVVFTPTVGSYACVRPSPGEQTWPVIRIEAASEGKVTVSDAQGRRRTVDLRDLIPLGK